MRARFEDQRNRGYMGHSVKIAGDPLLMRHVLLPLLPIGSLESSSSLMLTVGSLLKLLCVCYA